MNLTRSKSTNLLQASLIGVSLAVAVLLAVAVAVLAQHQSAKAQAASTEPSYTVTDLGTLGGTRSHAFDINDAGQVVGYSDASGDSGMHAFLYDASTTPKMNSLNTLAGIKEGGAWIAHGVNEVGQVVGNGDDNLCPGLAVDGLPLSPVGRVDGVLGAPAAILATMYART
jgi:probable HAF family extracellular repeat protein